MPKVTLDRNAFRALASDTRLDILKSLDGKKLSLKDISDVTNLNKATLHEHLSKLNEAGLVKKKSREGHKWVYYKLSWKGESLLHPENTRIVVLFAATFVMLWAGIIQVFLYAKEAAINMRDNSYYTAESSTLDKGASIGNDSAIPLPTEGVNYLSENSMFPYIAIICFIAFTIFLCISLWRLRENKTSKL